MRIEFEDKSYVELTMSPKPDSVFISIAARASDNVKKTIINSVEITLDQLKALVSEVIQTKNQTVEKPKKKASKKKDSASEKVDVNNKSEEP